MIRRATSFLHSPKITNILRYIVFSNTNDTDLREDTDQVSKFSIILDDDLTRLDTMEF